MATFTNTEPGLPAPGPASATICNVCGSLAVETVLTNARKESARFEHEPRRVMICRSCGLVCLDTSELSEEALAAYYSTFNHFETPGEASVEFRALSRDRYQWISERMAGPERPAGREVLDVGCGCGYLLHLFHEAGYAARGLDYSPAMIASLRELYGIDGVVGGFSANLVGRDRYGLVTCAKVLEHVLDPAAAVAQLREALRDGGYLFLEVPDSEFPVADCLPDFFAFDHLFHFTERTLGRLAENHGLEVVAVDHVPNTFESGNPGYALRLLARRRLASTAHYLGVNDYGHQSAVLDTYTAAHERYIAGLHAKIEVICRRASEQDLAIYCAGEHTSMLLEHLNLADLPIRYIFDSDRAISGKSLKGIPIRHSSEIPATGVRQFLLSTTNHEPAIHRALKAADAGYQVYGLYHDFD
jgi:SAM-dependent methyltransferase